MSKRVPRSHSYQYKIQELTFDLSLWSESWGLDRSPYHSEKQKEEFWDLNQQALDIIIDLLLTHTTNCQKNIIKLYLKGYTQIEIAKELNCNQSSISKTIIGNEKPNKKGEYYGGLHKKLINLILNCDDLKIILKKMKELEE